MWTNDAICSHRSQSTLSQLMACCLMVPCQPMLTSHKWGSVLIIWEQLHSNCLSYNYVECVWKLYFWNYCHIFHLPIIYNCCHSSTPSQLKYNTVRSGYNAVDFFTSTHKRPAIAGFFCGPASLWYSALVLAMTYAISCYIGQRYNVTLLYVGHSPNSICDQTNLQQQLASCYNIDIYTYSWPPLGNVISLWQPSQVQADVHIHLFDVSCGI